MKPISVWLNKVLQNDTQRPNSNYSATKYQKFVQDLDFKQIDFVPTQVNLHQYLNQNNQTNDREVTVNHDLIDMDWLKNGLVFESGSDHRRILVGHDYANEDQIIEQLRQIKTDCDVTGVVIDSKFDWYNSHTLDHNTTLVLVMSKQTFVAIQRQLEQYTQTYLVI